MTAKPFRVTTPYPTLAATARKLRIPASELRHIENLVDRVTFGKKKAAKLAAPGKKRAPG